MRVILSYDRQDSVLPKAPSLSVPYVMLAHLQDQARQKCRTFCHFSSCRSIVESSQELKALLMECSWVKGNAPHRVLELDVQEQLDCFADRVVGMGARLSWHRHQI